MDKNRRVSTAKAIAAVLGFTRRYVEYLIKTHQLPVNKTPGVKGRGGRWGATLSELEEWKKNPRQTMLKHQVKLELAKLPYDEAVRILEESLLWPYEAA